VPYLLPVRQSGRAVASCLHLPMVSCFLKILQNIQLLKDEIVNGPCLLDNLVIELDLSVVQYVALPFTLANC